MWSRTPGSYLAAIHRIFVAAMIEWLRGSEATSGSMVVTFPTGLEQGLRVSPHQLVSVHVMQEDTHEQIAGRTLTHPLTKGAHGAPLLSGSRGPWQPASQTGRQVHGADPLGFCQAPKKP
jgi:hypothetical protein